MVWVYQQDLWWILRLAWKYYKRDQVIFIHYFMVYNGTVFDHVGLSVTRYNVLVIQCVIILETFNLQFCNILIGLWCVIAWFMMFYCIRMISMNCMHYGFIIFSLFFFTWHISQRGKKCRPTKKMPQTKISLLDCCWSVESYRLMICNVCPSSNTCCVPERNKTIRLQVTCYDGTTHVEPFMKIRSCICVPGPCI